MRGAGRDGNDVDGTPGGIPVKISILVPNLSQNVLSRAHLLGKMLMRHYEVEIVGPVLDGGIWEPLADDMSVPRRALPVRGAVHLRTHLRTLGEMADGDVVYAVKPLSTSFGAGLLARIARKTPLVLDIDDWDTGLMNEEIRTLSVGERARLLGYSALYPFQIGSVLGRGVCERLIGTADSITVSSPFLQEKYGGEIVWHARDADLFQPSGYDRARIRENLGIDPDTSVLLFLGSPRPHKGMETLVEAVRRLDDRNVTLAIVGMDATPYCQALAEHASQVLGPRFLAYGMQPFARIPEFLAMSDIAVIPQQKNDATAGQVPAKIFDAMAMEKSIIATAVSSLPQILDGCGWVVEPEDPDRLADAVRFIVDNPDIAKQMGVSARKKFNECFSYDANALTLKNVFERFN